MSSPSDFGFTEEQVVYELATTFHANVLDMLVYGVYTGAYFVALYLTLSRGTERPRIGSAVIITVMWVLVTIHAGIRWVYLNNIYLRHGESREAQFRTRLLSRTTEFFSQSVADTVVSFMSFLLTDMTMIWRCWVPYGRRWIFVIIPGVSFVAGSACYIWHTIRTVTFNGVRSTDQIVNLELSYMSITVLTNIFCTTAIVYRIAVVSGWRKSFKTYHRLMEILIESSVLYTAVYAIRIGLQIHAQYFTEEHDQRMYFAQALGYSTFTGIAPTLIIARVAAGYARPDDSWTHSSLPYTGSTTGIVADNVHLSQLATGTVPGHVDPERNIGSQADDKVSI